MLARMNPIPPDPAVGDAARRRVLVILGHPDAQGAPYGQALARAYADGARAGGHDVRELRVGELDFPLLRSRAQWQQPLPESLQPAQDALRWCQHVVFVFPLWLGGMPALLKGFLEQVARPGFALGEPESPHALPRKLLIGRSARVVVTMGMPAFVYRWIYRAHSVKALERSILGMAGIAPIHETLIGSVEALDDARRARWLARLRRLGERAG